VKRVNHTITIIGLGAGDLDQLTIGVYKQLKQTESLYLRTKEHPVVAQLEDEQIKYESFDEIYEKQDQFEEVYEEIVKRLLEASALKPVVYAVPGHPLVAERTVQLLLARRSEGAIVEIAGGQSFLDPLFTAVEVDPIEGFQLLDGTELRTSELQLKQHLVIGQVYDSFIASEVKLTLMEKYPDEYEVYIVTAAGTTEQVVKKVLLYELDRDFSLNNLTSVYVPPVKTEQESYREFEKLYSIIATLRGPNGCPWDQEQTHESLKKHLIEESYELLDAIDRDDVDDIIEEAGDVLLQVLLHAQIGEDEDLFTIRDVIGGLSKKMVQRHPHVFGNKEAGTSDDVLVIWDEQKRSESKDEPILSTILDEVEIGLPGLLKSFELQKKATNALKDSYLIDNVNEKVIQVWQEFLEAIANDEKDEQMKRYGELLFTIVNLGLKNSIHPEEAIVMTNQAFYQRWVEVENELLSKGLKLPDVSREAFQEMLKRKS
jgi:tetrapyrrole methylase family protein/MazG family protein